MVTATSSRTPARTLAAVALVAAAAVLAVAGCSSAADDGPDAHPSGTVPAVGALAPKAAPAGWHSAALPDGAAVLAYPPVMHPVSGDRGTVSAAELSSSGAFLLYLNATPKQGDETLRDFPDFRLDHLTDDDASSDHLIARSFGVRFIGGTGTCVTDSYVTKVKSHHFTEIACFVRGRAGSSVVIAAAPSAAWAKDAPLLKRAVAAYQAR